MIPTQSTMKLPHELLERLRKANRAFASAYPGDSDRRTPVHTVYGGAHLFSANTAARAGEIALGTLRTYAPDFATFATALGLRGASDLAERVYVRTAEKLGREAVEDFRIDFEDGYGFRPDAEEDGHALRAAQEVARGLSAGTLPPFLGIRIKPLTGELYARSIRTLDLFITALLDQTNGRLPPEFFVTLPKVTVPEQVEALAAWLEGAEETAGLVPGSLAIELMVETTQCLIDARGQIALPALVAAAGGRCKAAHFGTYDYTASCDIIAEHQHMTHPACDFAKQIMKISLAGTGVALSDGATNILPIGPHRAKKGEELSPPEREENRAVVHRAWRLSYQHIRHSLVHGFYQGWDLHPAQLPARYGAVFSFFLEGLDSAGQRLRGFLEKAARATLQGDVFDDAATGQGLVNYFLRAIHCGAITEAEAEAHSGLCKADLRTRSFSKILAGRRG
jgi:citrate lyase beta subunit